MTEERNTGPGHNNPPDPLDEATAPFDAAREEAENWLDGAPVENEGQMQAVDRLIKAMKDAKRAVEAAQKAESAPLHDAWKAALARYKPTLDDLDRIVKGLVGTVDAFKRKLAAEKAEAERKAREEAEAKLRAAQEAHRAANVSDIEAQRAAAAAEREAEIARIKAAQAAKDTVKGMRAYTDYVVLDETALARWMWQNDRAALSAFLTEYATRNKLVIPGVVEARTERRAV